MPTTKDKDAKSKIYKKNLGKIARNKSRIWFWSKYLNTLGAITEVCYRIMPQMIPDRINSKLKNIDYITFKIELIPKWKFFINLFYTFQIKSCLIKINLKRRLRTFFSNTLLGMRICSN